MSESESKDSKLDVEAAQPVSDGVSRQEKDIKDGPIRSKSDSLPLPDTEDVPAITLEGADDDLDADADADSEAETLIQSPEKKRNSVADGSNMIHQLKVAGSRSSETGSVVLTSTSDKENATRKRKRSQEEGAIRSPDRISSHRSSPLSSPVAHIPSDIESSDGAASDTETSVTRTGRQPSLERISSPRKRRRPPSELTASHSSHKRSKRNSVETIERRETRSATYPRPSDDEKSPSPEVPTRREHRRGASTQSTPYEFERRKRGRPPNIHTRRNRSADRVDHSSDESEPRTSRSRPHLHKFASNDHDTMSPIKDIKTGPRKWKDKNGRTYLARACNNNDLEAARARYAERPEDLNMEDNAGNTPLQIAALEGFDEIVEFLLSKGAEVNARNVDKDTPLLDAVENGHVEVVKLLLKYGANPRLANAKGDEPYEMVHPDDDNYAEIRELLAGAKEKESRKIAGIDASDFQGRDGAVSRATSAASPRDSPPIGPRSPPAFGSRRRTGRSESTRNDLLWQANTQENLAKLASKGDSQGVASILSILEKAETEAVIAAAKAGHEEVLQLLIAMGKPNPDPDPVRGSKMVPGYNTPILAAIGRGHPDVVKLLANQGGFNPTRRYKDRTYFELAEERGGDRWEEEFNVLKQAYDRYAIAKGRKPSSPRKTRDVERSKPRTARRSSSVTSAKRPMSSPNSTHKTLPTKTADGPHRELRKTSDPISGKHKPTASSEAMDGSIAVASDADQTVATQKKGHRTRRSQSDLPPPPSLDNEPIHKRRRLVTGKEHRSRHTISTSSDNEGDNDGVRVKQEESQTSALKRTRTSSTSNAADEADASRASTKKRRTLLESSPDDQKSHNLPSEDIVFTATPGPDTAVAPAEPEDNNSVVAKSPVDAEMVDRMESEGDTKPADAEAPPANGDQAIKHESPTLTEDPKIPLSDDIPTVSNEQQKLENQTDDASEDSYSPPPAVEPPPDSSSEEAERQKQEEVEKAAAEQRIKAEAEKLAAEEKAKEEAERKAEQERAEEAARVKAAEELRLKQEAEQKRQKEEEMARRKKEEEEKQERQRQEMESRRHFEQLEQERKRLEALPIVLARTAQMIDQNNSDVRSPQWLSKFLPLYSVKTRQLDPNDEDSNVDDEWIPSFQVAGLLTTKDLNLLSYTSFDKKPVTDHQRRCLWRVARLKLSYDANSIRTVTVSKATEVERVAEEKFMSMAELFWVRLSDFMDQTSRFPHLADLNLSRQAISLKSYEEILGTRTKTRNLTEKHVGLGLPNGVVVHTNGENGIA